MHSSLIHSNLALLAQARDVVTALSAPQFAIAPEGFHSSIGQHIRHVLDHYRSLIQACDEVLDYERRERNTAVETQPAAALAQIARIGEQLSHMPPRALRVQIEACHREAQTTLAASSTERELMFVLSHTVHHFAIIGIYLRAFGVAAPPEFGVAPSTLRFQEQSAKAMPALA